MEKVINNLKKKEIIYRKSIEVIKNHIRNKYPEASETFCAQVFADAVHKIIDDNIREFRREDQRKIKSHLLKSTATKAQFEIVAYDIIKTCVALDIDEETFIDDMTSWINRQQPIPVYREQMVAIKEELQDTLRIEEENRQAMQVGKDARLLRQLEAAFNYKAKYDTDPPELFVEGEPNEAYEAEVMKDEDLSAVAQEQDEALQNLFEEGTLNADDSTVETELDEEVQATMDDRPVIKVERQSQMDVLKTEEVFTADEETPEPGFYDKKIGRWTVKEILVYCLFALAVVLVGSMLAWSMINGPTEDDASVPEPTFSTTVTSAVPERTTLARNDKDSIGNANIGKTDVVLASHLRYKEIDNRALKSWFSRRGSLIGEHPYFEILLEVAWDYDVNPLLLFAISGQEQNFVPRNHQEADRIINNPFNVYHSWENYNTTFEESVQIASRTIYSASEGLPPEEDPIRWINGTYAEDPKWHEGVTAFLTELEAVAGIDTEASMD